MQVLQRSDSAELSNDLSGLGSHRFKKIMRASFYKKRKVEFSEKSLFSAYRDEFVSNKDDSSTIYNKLSIQKDQFPTKQLNFGPKKDVENIVEFSNE